MSEKRIEKDWFEAVAAVRYCVLCHADGVQVSHSNALRGLGQKSEPWNTAALCPVCHTLIDSGKDLTQLQRRELHFEAVVRTHDAMIRMGTLKLIAPSSFK